MHSLYTLALQYVHPIYIHLTHLYTPYIYTLYIRPIYAIHTPYIHPINNLLNRYLSVPKEETADVCLSPIVWEEREKYIAPPDPKCCNGVSDGGRACCLKSCGSCGSGSGTTGASCGKREGGYDGCCGGGVKVRAEPIHELY